MPQDKIRITKHLIEFIIFKRKELNMTAYQLSEKIGKNKSWLPNIENKRTKNISKNDLCLLLRELVNKEDFSPEQYVEKYFSRDNSYETDNDSISYYNVPQKTDVDYQIEKDNLLSNISYVAESPVCYGNKKEPVSTDLLLSLKKLTDTIKENIYTFNNENQEYVIRCIDIMTENFENDFERTLDLYGNSYCPTDPLSHESKVRHDFLASLDLFRDVADTTIHMMVSRAFVYSFIEETPFETYKFFDKIRNWEQLPEAEDEKLYLALDDIKNYHFGVYSYIEDWEKYSSIFKDAPPVEFQLVFTNLHEMFKLYIDVAKINCSFDFTIPTDSATHEEVEKLHRQTDKIIFNIEKEVRYKFKNRNSWCFS